VKTAFELRPAGNLFPIAGRVGKGAYRPVRPLPARPEDVPIFTLQELDEIWGFLLDFFRECCGYSLQRDFNAKRWKREDLVWEIRRHVTAGRPASNATAGEERPHHASNAAVHEAPVSKQVAVPCVAAEIDTFAQLAAFVCRNRDILTALFEEFKVRQALDGKAVHCPFHSPDNHPSMTIRKTADGRLRIRDWHDGTDYDIPSLHHALRTGDPGPIDKNAWAAEVAQIARKHGLIPSEDEVKSQLAGTAEIATNPATWEGLTPASVRRIQAVFQAVYDYAVKFGNLYVGIGARTLAELTGLSVKEASRAANFLAVAGVLEKLAEGKNRANYRVNPHVTLQQVRQVVQAFVQSGWTDVSQISQNVVAEFLDARVAFETYTRQSDEWEVEGKLPAWSEPFVPEE
ncbi:MAG: hypothetical protein ACPLRU_07425, partial [Desulfofundulus sp.]